MQAEDTTPLKPTRASFIRGLPLAMPVGEVIERGREAGIDINPSDVHSARYYMRQAAATQPPASGLALAAHFVPSRGVVTPTKRTDANENGGSTNVLSAGVVTGRTIKANVIEDKEGALRGTVVRVRSAPTKTRARRTEKLTGSLDDQLRVLVMRLGTDRTRAIIEQLEGMTF